MMLKDRIIIVTGGDSGIGLGIAKLFLEMGAQIVVTGRDTHKLNQVKTDLGKNCLAILADVTQIKAINLLYEKVYKHFNRNFDGLVVNAGISLNLSISKVSESDFDKIFAVNVKGAYFTARNVINYLNPGASIIFIASMAAKFGLANFSVYAASKAAVISMAQCFAAELAEKKIRVNSISPGVIVTPIHASLGITENDINTFSAKIPLKRAGLPQDIAQTALFLISNQSDYITGADFAVDGGLTNAF